MTGSRSSIRLQRVLDRFAGGQLAGADRCGESGGIELFQAIVDAAEYVTTKPTLVASAATLFFIIRVFENMQRRRGVDAEPDVLERPTRSSCSRRSGPPPSAPDDGSLSARRLPGVLFKCDGPVAARYASRLLPAWVGCSRPTRTSSNRPTCGTDAGARLATACRRWSRPTTATGGSSTATRRCRSSASRPANGSRRTLIGCARRGRSPRCGRRRTTRTRTSRRTSATVSGVRCCIRARASCSTRCR